MLLRLLVYKLDLRYSVKRRYWLYRVNVETFIGLSNYHNYFKISFK